MLFLIIGVNFNCTHQGILNHQVELFFIYLSRKHLYIEYLVITTRHWLIFRYNDWGLLLIAFHYLETFILVTLYTLVTICTKYMSINPDNDIDDDGRAFGILLPYIQRYKIFNMPVLVWSSLHRIHFPRFW